MSDEIYFDGKRFVSAGDAASLAGLSRDYVAKLCRDGKVTGRRVGKNWYVSDASLKSFLVNQVYTKAARMDALSSERVAAYRASHGNGTMREIVDLRHAGASAHVLPEVSAARQASSARKYEELPAIRSHRNLRSAIAGSGGTVLARAHGYIATPGVADAAMRMSNRADTMGAVQSALSSVHVPVHAITPAAEFVHKLVALTLAFAMTFGTYALVDPQYARFAMQSISDSGRALVNSYQTVGSSAVAFSQHSQEQLALAAENPQAALAAASLSIGMFVPEVTAKIARVVNAQVDRWVYAVSFPQDLVQSLGIVAGDGSSGSVTVQVQPYARPRTIVANTATVQSVQPSNIDAGLTTIINQPVIERVIETERIVTSGGITESELTDKLNQLNNRLVAQIYSQTSAISSPIATGGIVNNFAGSQRIDRVSGAAITGGTITGAAISGGSITGVSLSAGDLSGTVGIANGGTGTSTAPSYGELLVGDGNGGYSIAATSTLGLSPSSLLSTENTWTALQIFSASASSTDFSNTGTAYFGGTATTTIDSAGNIFAAGTLSVTNLASFALASTSQLSVFDRAYFGGTATSTFDSTGFLTLPSGFLSQASSTIGDGTQAGGLTISGGATTTGDFVISKASAPTTGNLYFGNGTANINYNSSDFTFTGGSLYTAAGRITSVGLNESTGVGVRYVSGDGTYYIGATHSASPDFVFTNNGNIERARLTDAGSFGIGTTSPWKMLSVAGDIIGTNITATGTLAVSGLSTFAGLISTASSTIGDGTQAGGLTISGGATTTGSLAITATTGTTTIATGQGFTIGNSQFVLQQGSGYVGIGTTTPSSQLQVWASGATGPTFGSTVLGSFVRSAGNAELAIASNAASRASLYFGDTAASDVGRISYNNSTNAFEFYTNTSQRATIDSSGNFGIGTTTPNSKLSVTSSGNNGLNLDADTSNGTLSSRLFLSTATAGQAVTLLNNTGAFSVYTGGTVGSSAGTQRLTVSSSGDVGIGTTSPYAKLSVVGPVAAEYFHATSTTATSTFAGGSMFGTNRLVILQNGNIGVGTAAPTTGFDVGVNTRITGDLTVGGGSSVTFSNTGPINQSGTGQVTFAGNVDATNGLDVTTANFTVGGSNFIVAPGTGNTTVAGTLGLTGALAASSTFQLTGAARFYSSLQTDGALTAAAAGTGLSVTNNATVGGTLGVTGLGTFSNGLTITAGTLTAGAANFTGEVSIGSNKIVGLASPTADTDAANKIYVDSVAQGLTLKDSVRAGTTANITLSGEQTIDGVSLVTGDRVLVKDQSDQTKNGIYVVASGSWSRSTDADADSEVSSGLFTFISEGTANSNSGWVLTTANPITLGTSLLSFTQFSGAGQIIAGTGISKSGNTLDVGGTADRITANADTIDIASTYVGQSSITTVGTLTSGSLGTGFGNINIGASSITGGVATFSSIVGSAINGTGDLTISGAGTFSNGLTISAGTLSAGAATFSQNVALGGNKITGLADPTSAQEAATKAYVDAVAQGLTVKASVRAGTTANITLSGEQTIDGVAIVAGDRVLVKDQSTGSQNGIYVASAGAWSRATDMNENSEAVSGVYTFLTEGTAQANTGWSLITPNVITLDTTSLTFTQFSGSAETTAGDGLTKTGNTINVVGTADRITVTSDAIDIAATYSGQSSILTVGTLTSGAIGSGFGAINIGSSALTAGAATFASAKSFGSLLVGGMATTTISGDSATSTFSGGISLAGGNVNLATGGNFLINNVLALNATSLGANVVSSSLTSVGALDSGSITTGFGDINIGANTLDAGTTTLTNLAVTNTSTSTFAGGLTIGGSSGFVYQQATGKVGIGTASPAYNLVVYGVSPILSLNNSGAVSNIQQDGTGLLFNVGTGALRANVGGSERIRITTAGNVGVGTTTPWGLLSVNANALGSNVPQFVVGSSTATNLIVANNGNVGIGTASPDYRLSVDNASGDSSIRINGSAENDAYLRLTEESTVDYGGMLKYDGAANIFQIGTLSNGSEVPAVYIPRGSGNVGVGTTSPWAKLSIHANNGETNTALFNIASSTASATSPLFTVLNTGNVGIGTTTPPVKLTVANGYSASALDSNEVFQFANNNTSAYGTIRNNANNIFYSGLTSTQGFVGTQTSLPLALRTAAQDRLTITAAGLVGIGTTTPGVKLEVQGTGASFGGASDIVAGFKASAGNGYIGVDTSSATADSGIRFSSNGTRQWSIFSDATNNKLGFYDHDNSSSLLTLVAGGNVGIGTTTPNAALSVYGDIFAEGSNRYLNFGTVQGTSGYGFRDNAGTIEFKQSSGDWAAVGSGADAWTHPVAGQSATTSLMLFSGGASSTIFSNFGTAYFGGTATSTFDSIGALSLVSNGLTVGTSQLVVSSGNVGIGTTTPWGKLAISTTAQQDGAIPLFNIASTTNTSLFTVLGNGNVGIGTTTPNRLLTLSNSGATNQLLFEDTGASADQHYFSLGTSRGGFTLNSLTDALATTTRFTVDSSGNVGVGTTTPFRKLAVTDTVSNAQFAVAYDATRYTQFQTDASGDLVVDPSGDDAFLNDDNLWVCTGGSCPAGTPTGTGNLIVENKIGVATTTPTGTLSVQGSGTGTGYSFVVADSASTQRFNVQDNGNVGIGTTSPSAQLATAGLIFVGGNGAITLGTATSTFYGDIKIAGKLDVGTIDPVYTVDGIKFATYGHSTIGIHEETLKTIQLTEQDESGKYSYTIDFDAQEKGSDLWLFYQITDFGSEWKSLVVSLTPSFDGTVFYKKVPEKKQLIVYADAPGEVSMRLSGNRFDFSKWPNLRTDQDGDTTGTHIISSKK